MFLVSVVEIGMEFALFGSEKYL